MIRSHLRPLRPVEKKNQQNYLIENLNIEQHSKKPTRYLQKK